MVWLLDIIRLLSKVDPEKSTHINFAAMHDCWLMYDPYLFMYAYVTYIA